MLGVPELAVVLVIVLVLFGPKKLPDIGASLGKGIRDFKKAFEDDPPKQTTEPEVLTKASREAAVLDKPPSS
jgi:sec-independent protein translocase protein TatA